MSEPTAATVLARLHAMQSDEELRKYARYFKFGEGEYAHGDRFIGVRMGQVFALAKEMIDLPPAGIEVLMESDIHEARAAAMSIMAKQYAARKTMPERRQDLFDLYLRRHDRINNWDLVDLAAYYVVGPHLVDRPRDVLYALARSQSQWERRTAILATFAFIRRRDYADALAIAELLLGDSEDLVRKAVGWMLRSISDRAVLVDFLERHAATMPRITLRNAIEKFSPEDRARWLAYAKR